MYTNSELTDMVLMYGRAGGNALAAQRLYQETFPERRVPHYQTFVSAVQRLRETGRFASATANRGRQRTRRVLEAEPQILDAVEENPGTSIRRLSFQIGLSAFVVWRTLKEQGLHPYHVRKVQALKPEDMPRRIRFCQWIIWKNLDDPGFLSNLLSTDEATFTRDGVFNAHNTHIWAVENPHAIHESNFQDKFKVNVWAGLLGNRLIGPYILPPRLTAVAYLEFLINILPDLLDGVPLLTRRHMWYLHDGAPSHYAFIVANWLNNSFPGRWIGRNGPVLWPPRSPDLNPCDFFLWGYMKQLVYASPVNTVAELTMRINNAAAHIRANPDMILKTQQSLIRRAEVCIRNGGQHFEQQL